MKKQKTCKCGTVLSQYNRHRKCFRCQMETFNKESDFMYITEKEYKQGVKERRKNAKNFLVKISFLQQLKK